MENEDMLSVVLEEKESIPLTPEIMMDNLSDDLKQAIIIQESKELEKKRLEEQARNSLDLVKSNSGNSQQQVSYGYFTPSNPNKVIIDSDKRNKYMIIPDLHYWYKNISCRKDYLGEIDEALNNIFMIIASDETINNVILAGDIYHRGFNDLDSSRAIKRYWSELKHMLNSRGGELYAVIGNHEFSFSKNNPFWLQDDVIFKTPEDIFDNGVHFYLESYHSKKSIREFRDKVDANICITHNEVLPPEMAEFVRRESGRRVFTSNKCTSFSRYNVDALFVGHMHQVVDTFMVNDEGRNFEVQYLGSIGRTSVEEISNDFRQRNLPVVEVGIDKDGNEGKGLFTVTQMLLELREYHETVISEQVEKSRKVREKQKEMRELKLQKVTDDPIEEFKREVNSSTISDIVDCAYESRRPVEVINLVSSIMALLD